MKTLKELLKDKALPVKLEDLDRGEIFEAHGIGGYVVGYWEKDGLADWFRLDYEDFKLYTPPKLVKKTMYCGLHKHKDGSNELFVSHYLHDTKEKALSILDAIGFVEVIVEVKSE